MELLLAAAVGLVLTGTVATRIRLHRQQRAFQRCQAPVLQALSAGMYGDRRTDIELAMAIHKRTGTLPNPEEFEHTMTLLRRQGVVTANIELTPSELASLEGLCDEPTTRTWVLTEFGWDYVIGRVLDGEL